MLVKICGLFRDEDIDFVNAAKPDFIGFVFFAKSHRNVTLERAAALKAKLDKNIKAVGVFVDEPYESMVKYAGSGVLDAVQLHGHEDNAYVEKLRKDSAIEIWQAFKIRSKEDARKAERSAADMLVLDNGMGTGETFDWSLLSNAKRDFFLAGGINAENIDKAIALSPYGIDVSSGAETNKIKDKNKIDTIVKKVKGLNVNE